MPRCSALRSASPATSSPPPSPQHPTTTLRPGPRARQLLVALVDELHDTSTVSDHTWTALTEHYDEAQLVELVALAGQYHAVSFMANALGVEREDAAQRFPAAKAA